MIVFVLQWCYFPASGYRHGVGKLGNVGVASYLWSVSSLGKVLYSGAVFTCFVEMVNVIANGNRYVGRPVRCVQELAGILYHFDSFFEDVIRMV